ncbi:hypothetical protein D3C72_1668460 [compost metagenome]
MAPVRGFFFALAAVALGFLRITLAVPLAISTRVGQRTSRSCYEYEAGKYRYH